MLAPAQQAANPGQVAAPRTRENIAARRQALLDVWRHLPFDNVVQLCQPNPVFSVHDLDGTHLSLSVREMAEKFARSDADIPTPPPPDGKQQPPPPAQNRGHRPAAARVTQVEYLALTRAGIVARSRTGTTPLVRNIMAWYLRKLSARVSSALIKAETLLCVVTTKTLEVPLDVYVRYIGPLLGKAAGVAHLKTPRNVYKFLLTDMSQVDKVIDPNCQTVERTASTGTTVTCSMVCTNERPCWLRYAKGSELLTVRFWVSVVGPGGVPALSVR